MHSKQRLTLAGQLNLKHRGVAKSPHPPDGIKPLGQINHFRERVEMETSRSHKEWEPGKGTEKGQPQIEGNRRPESREEGTIQERRGSRVGCWEARKGPCAWQCEVVGALTGTVNGGSEY